MRYGARTPEELEQLLEDAWVLHDLPALVDLFGPGAVLATADRVLSPPGDERIVALAASLWGQGRTYVADPRRILQAHDAALVLSPRSVNVLRRDAEGFWRFAICCLNLASPPS